MNSNRPVIVGLGEVLWDEFADGKHPGGAPANVAFQAQQLGGTGVVASRVGNDSAGQELVEYLQSKGLDTRSIQVDEDAPTGRVTVSINEKNQPEYVIHENVAWDRIAFTEELAQLMQSASAVCFGTLAQRCEISRQSIQKAVAATSDECLCVYDINLRQDYFHRDWITASFQLADVVKLNDEEVGRIAPLLELPHDEEEFTQALIKQFQVNLVCVTRGANGCLITSADEVITVPGSPIQVADTVGAGDAFTAGLIDSLLRGKSIKESGEFANRIGGLVASHQGAMPDLRNQFAQLRSEEPESRT